MSGHSKWANIHRKKEANDKVKGSVFTKMAKAITIAVKKGGGVGDPDMNFALRLAVDKARGVNMPKENIDRAIDKGTGKGESIELAELTIEGFAPGGVAVMVEAVTDNSNRTVAELRNLMEKQGGRMGEPGSVAYLFEKVGIVNYAGQMSDELELALIDQGMVDWVQEPESGVVYTEPEKLHSVVTLLLPQLAQVTGTLGYRPLSTVPVEDETKVQNFLEMVAEHDDVQEVYANFA